MFENNWAVVFADLFNICVPFLFLHESLTGYQLCQDQIFHFDKATEQNTDGLGRKVLEEKVFGTPDSQLRHHYFLGDAVKQGHVQSFLTQVEGEQGLGRSSVRESDLYGAGCAAIFAK